MKKALSLLTAAAVIAVATTAMASTISASKHNLSASGPTGAIRGTNTGANTQICIYCHTPHNASTTMPIWNRNTGKAASTYKLYSGLGMQNVSNKTLSDDSVSLFCMSCHDGSQLGGNMILNQGAADAFDPGLTDTTNPSNIPTTARTNFYKTGGDLRGTHPINFEVKSSNPLATVQNDLQTVNLGNINGYPLFKSAKSATNTLECSSCHSVHDNTNSPFLRTTQVGSALCLGCHNK